MAKKSIAKRMNNYWINASLGNFITIDLIFIISSIICRCVIEEQKNGVSGLLTSRYFEITKAEGIVYCFGGNTADFDGFFKYLFIVMSAAAAAQLILLAASAHKGGREARRILRPIEEIAVSAKDIAAAPIPKTIPEPAPETSDNISDTGLSDLQTAINRLDPADASHIHTGNSELKELEDAVNSLLDRMRENYRRQAQFVSDASHELRTPIAVIQGYAGMLDRWGKSDEKVLDEAVSAIKGESEHITKLVEELLFLARGDNGRQTMNMDIFSLSEIIADVCAEYRLIDSDHSYSDDIIADVSCWGDSSMIKQTARILTDNAKKYTPKGGSITLRVRRNIQGEVCFDVQDTGIGMEQKEIEHIFERFYRADPARSRDTGGTGLGLAIAKWIVDAHNGRFEISSCAGIGTRMTVVLPRISPDSADFILNEEKAETKSRRIEMKK